MMVSRIDLLGVVHRVSGKLDVMEIAWIKMGIRQIGNFGMVGTVSEGMTLMRTHRNAYEGIPNS